MTVDRYVETFSKLKSRDEKAFIPFTVLGYPDADKCLETIKLMIDCGASALELGVPFSDPVADGPIIQQAAFSVIENQFSLADAFALIARVRAYNSEIPIGLLTYYNTILSQTAESYFADCRKAGVDSVLIADLPVELSEEVVPTAKAHNIAIVFIVSPMTTDDRIKQIATAGSGYIYVVSRLGITGTEEKYDPQLQKLLQDTRKQTKLPLCVGFGISSPQQAERMLSMGADGVITGSKVIDLINADSQLKTLRGFLENMKATVSAKHAPA